jgi:hypothetical protein
LFVHMFSTNFGACSGSTLTTNSAIMSTLTKIAGKITATRDELIKLLKEEGLLMEAVVATVVFTLLLVVLI